MRNAFVSELSLIAAEDPNSFLITGDLGFGVLDEFARRFPRQYLNAGVAEQNMTALAVGLSLEGRTVYTYSIANFPTLRCLEHIRNDACYHQVNLKIVSVGGGFAYGPLGISHHATEDLAIMRALPNVSIFAPGDPQEVISATRIAHHTAGVCYLRLGRGGESNVHKSPVSLKMGQIFPLWPEGEVVLLSTGGILAEAESARNALMEQNISTALYSVPFLKPFNEDFIRELAASRKAIVTVEEHTIIGGLGAAVAEVLAELPGRSARLIRCGLRQGFSSTVGSQEYLRSMYGIDSAGIVRQVLSEYRR